MIFLIFYLETTFLPENLIRYSSEASHQKWDLIGCIEEVIFFLHFSR